MENHVSSLELSKKLKELGVKQESYFYWREGYHTHEWRDGEDWKKEGIFEGKFEVKAYPKPRFTTADVKWNERDLARLDETEVSAFTVAELGEMFPQNIQLPFKKDGLAQEYWYWSSEKGRHREDTEADARAKMLVYLLEQGIIKVEDINK